VDSRARSIENFQKLHREENKNIRLLLGKTERNTALMKRRWKWKDNITIFGEPWKWINFAQIVEQ
jgi:hypothetical protein